MSDIRADDLTDVTDRLLLEAQRAAAAGDWSGAAAASDEALKNDPTRAEAMYLVALALRKDGNEGTAALVLNVATKLAPKRWMLWLELAKCLHERHPKDAYRAALTAQKLKPDHVDILSVLCNVASTLGRHAEALEYAERCEKLHGFVGEVSHNSSFALMALGRWKEGWKAFRPSLGQAARPIRNYHADQETPRWNPTKHKDAVVAIYGEQGVGDEIMYASMIDKAIAAAEARGSRVVIDCNPRLQGLFARSFGVPCYGFEARAEWPRDEGVTHKIEMGGLGEYFAPEPFRLGSFLAPDPARSQAWAAWLDCANRPDRNAASATSLDPNDMHNVVHLAGGHPSLQRRVGLAWTGGSWETGRGRRSIPFELILQLMRGQDCTFVNLEYEDRRKDLEFAPDMLNPVTATKKGADMDELAALLVNLDLVISVQTSVVDLCGALGVPCWAVTDEVPQWRYTGYWGDATMAFYDSVKVYRQKEWGQWAAIVNKLAWDLKAWTQALANSSEPAALSALS